MIRCLLRRLFRRCGCAVVACAALTSLATAGGGHGVNVRVFGGGGCHQAACFVQPQVNVQAFAVPLYQQQFQVAVAAQPVQVATFQTFAAPVCAQSYGCGGGVNVQAFGGGGRQRIFGGGTRINVRVRSR